MEADTTSYFSRSDDRLLNASLVGVLVLQYAIVFVALRLMNASIDVVLLVAALILIVNVANVFVITWSLWKPYERRWPAQPIRTEAVVRGFQTVWFGALARYNHCVHVAVDERCIHVTPMAPLRWCGAKTISLPLDDLTDVRRSLWPGMSAARLHGRRIAGPSWCMKLAAVAEP